MERLTKRVGVGEAVPVADGDICAPFVSAGRCKTGKTSRYGPWERHCNDECVLGMIIDRLAEYEDIGMTPADILKNLERLKKYEDLGTVEELDEALYNATL